MKAQGRDGHLEVTEKFTGAVERAHIKDCPNARPDKALRPPTFQLMFCDTHEAVEVCCNLCSRRWKHLDSDMMMIAWKHGWNAACGHFANMFASGQKRV